VYKKYQALLRQSNAVDFDDLVLLSVRLLSENSEVRAALWERFHYVMIDEYQDTNRPQYMLSHILANNEITKKQNICVVGDVDQSIYGWRGAYIKNILEFERDYPDAKVVKLERNYR